MKKAITMLATAGLLASLLGTALVGTASAAVSTWTGTGNLYLATCNPTTCQQVADGNTQLQLFAPAGTGLAAGYMTVTGASFAGASQTNYHWDATTGTLSITGSVSSTTNDWISLKSATAGTAVVSIWSQANIYTPGTLTGTVSVTFYAAGTSGISAGTSFSKTVAVTAGGAVPNTDCATTGYTFTGTGVSSGSATTGTQRAWLCVFVGNSATPGIGVGGLSVSATISPVGLLTGAGTGQAVTLTPGTTAGVYYAAIYGSGVAGAATITLSTSSLLGGTIVLGTQTFTFTGGIAKITAAAVTAAANKSGVTLVDAISFKAYDAAGNRVPTTNATASASTGAPFSVFVSAQTTALASGAVDVTCNGVEGSGTVTVKYTSTDGLTVITSNAVTMYCSGTATSFTVAFDKTNVAPGGSATLTATAKDAAGQPAAGYEFTGTLPGTPNITPGSPAVVSSGVLWLNPLVDGDQGDGTTTWSFLAPFTAGVVTAAVTDNVKSVAGGYTNLGTKYASITVGAGVTPPPPTFVGSGSAASHLGITTSGPFTTATKIPAIGKYVTVKFTMGAAAAGAHVIVLVATKHGTVWSAFVNTTTRIADASGNVYYFYRSFSAAWLSFRVDSGTTCQARWM